MVLAGGADGRWLFEQDLPAFAEVMVGEVGFGDGPAFAETAMAGEVGWCGWGDSLEMLTAAPTRSGPTWEGTGDPFGKICGQNCRGNEEILCLGGVRNGMGWRLYC